MNLSLVVILFNNFKARDQSPLLKIIAEGFLYQNFNYPKILLILVSVEPIITNTSHRLDFIDYDEDLINSFIDSEVFKTFLLGLISLSVNSSNDTGMGLASNFYSFIIEMDFII